MRHVRSALIVAAATAAALVPTAAHANTYRHTDAVADVYSTTVAPTGTYTPAPDRVAGDVVSSMVKHKSHSVLLQLAYRDLPNDAETDVHTFFIRTNKLNRTVRLYANSSNPGGKAILFKNEKKVRCHVRRAINYTAHTATVVVPRSCLGNPRWVKVGMGGVMVSGPSATDTTWIDDAMTTGTDGTARFSPKVFR